MLFKLFKKMLYLLNVPISLAHHHNGLRSVAITGCNLRSPDSRRCYMVVDCREAKRFQLLNVGLRFVDRVHWLQNHNRKAQEISR